MPIIIGIPPHDIMQPMPIAIIAFMALQRSVIISIAEASIGIILQTMPSLVISQVIRHIIGIAIIGMPLIMGIPIPPPIIGMPPIIGFMPPIIGIMPPIMGFMPFIIDIIGLIIGMGIIIGMPPAEAGFIPPIIGIADIGVIAALLSPVFRGAMLL